ncbi:MAG: type III-B CRISPR-associated protein Cas10/Cmr2 [Cyanobacteria bacterium P01_F01_bin.56]
MTDPVYTAITFAPVQGFIEKSRKLRDLYGSSFILSYLSEQVCNEARHHLRPNVSITQIKWPDDPVVSPALISVTQGVPNQILIKGKFPRDLAEQAFYSAWKKILDACKSWIEAKVQLRKDETRWDYGYWSRFWDAWGNHAWEFFWATGIGETGDAAKEALNEVKFARAWTGVNWTGESSTLSGMDGRAWPHMGQYDRTRSQAAIDAEVKEFYGQLMSHLSEATITDREFLSIPELVKRLVTVPDVVRHAEAAGRPQRLKVEVPFTFKDVNRLLNQTPDNEQDSVEEADRNGSERNQEEVKRWTGWFQGDGDRAGDFLLQKPDSDLHRFSENMRCWGKDLWKQLPKNDFQETEYQQWRKKLDKDGRIVYAGGDDFLGILYRNAPYPEMSPLECLQWFETFKSTIWSQAKEPITVSVGFVWAAPNVPQRDVLQHCRESEQSAKRNGRDRIALRILFNDGKHLEWTCPWWLLEGNPGDELAPETAPETGILAAYRDRRQVQGHDAQPNWTHLYNDVAALEARHGFAGGIEVALGLIEIYFGKAYRHLLSDRGIWWNQYHDLEDKKYPIFTGILGDADKSSPDPEKAFNDWVISLAKVGFHMTQPIKPVFPSVTLEAA